MRPRHAVAAMAVLFATAAAIVAGGRGVGPPQTRVSAGHGTGGEVARHEVVSSAAPLPKPEAARRSAPSRAIEPQVVAPPLTGDAPLQRAAPRPPLSDLALAQSPRPEEPGALEDKPLYRPVAVAAGKIEAGGHTIAIAGIGIVEPDRTCTDAAGKAWACGLAARTAFRAFLRGRAIVCASAKEEARGTVTAACSLGKRDIGHWLAENGWARAPETGSYAEAGKAAREAGKGIYGAAPDLSGLPPPPPPVEMAAPGLPSFLDLSGTAATPPIAPPAPAE